MDDIVKQRTILQQQYRLELSSMASYGTGFRSYVDFALKYSVVNEQGDILPPSEHGTSLWVTWLLMRGVQSYDQYLSHLRTSLDIMQLSSDDTRSAALSHLVSSGRLFLKETGRIKPRKVKIALTPQDLAACARKLRPHSNLLDLQLLTTMSVGFYGLFRAGELTLSGSAGPFNEYTMLRRQDVTIHGTHAVIWLQHSKTDRMGNGTSVTIPAIPNCDYCPVKLLQLWLARSAADGNTRPNAPLFGLRHQPFKKSDFISRMRSALRLSGSTNHSTYTGHSLRLGGATWAKAAGLDADEIMVLGRWTTDVYQRYIQYSPEHRILLANRIAAASQSQPAPILDDIDHSTWACQAQL
jgi:hypothetical protein